MRSLCTALLTLVVACLAPAPAAATSAQARFDFDTTPGRLSKQVLPERYALTLTVDPEADTFSGEATVTLRVRQPVPAIVLHARELTAGAALLGRRTLAVQADATAQTWTLTPTDGAAIAAGEHRLSLAWGGRVRRSGEGLYRAPHQVDGKTVNLLATQLQAIFARLVFPAFDEPAFRSVFEIAVRAPAGYEVLSNMNATGAVAEGAAVLHRFAPTPSMPAYLVAVAVGRFDMLAGSAAGVPLRIFAAPGKRAQAAYALASTQKLLPYYNDYFGLPYVLPKLDQLAVPSTRRGAMEDWGLISYAESALLFDPASSDTQTERGIFGIIAHEVSHQWFGNLVTAASWDEIWLNEAFATWMTEKATDHFNPAWQTLLRRRQDIDWTLGRDAGPATRAIRSGTVAEDRVFDAFDSITYVKGGAVLSMLEQWLGAEPFRRGLAAYMQARRDSNATAGDLWFHIGEASGRDVTAVASSWTDQAGFPLVSVASRCDRGRTVLTLRQRRFSNGPDAAAAGAAASAATWQVPLLLQHGGKTHRLLLAQARQRVTLPGCPALPTLVNPGGEGYYRVAYAPALHAALARGFATLPVAAQVTLLSDTFALAQAGRLPMTAYLDLLAAVPQAQGAGRPALWAQARTGLRFLAEAFARTPVEAPLFAAGRALLAPELARVGWGPQPGAPEEDGETRTLRSSLIRDLAQYDHGPTVAHAMRLFDADEAGSTPLPPEIRAAVMRAVGRHADPVRFGQLMARLKAAQREEDQWLFAVAVASAPDPLLAQQVLDLSVQAALPGNIATALPGIVAAASPNAELAYGFVLAHWPQLAERAGSMFGARNWLLPRAAQGFNERSDADRLLADQQRLAGPPGAAAAAQTAVRLELRAAVKARDAQALQVALPALQRRLVGTAP